MRVIPCVFLCCLAALAAPPVLCAQSGGLRLDPVADSVAGGLALTGTVLTEFVIKKPAPALPVSLDRGTVNALDALAILPYDDTLSTVSDITMAASAAAPFSLLIFTDWRRWGGYGVVYAESMGTAITIKNVLKLTIDRWRPRLYWDGDPGGKQAEETNLSFPSGHATTSFAAAACLATIIAEEYPAEPWALPVAAGGFALAGGTAVLRVAAGQHFITDVLAGAAIGSASGFLATWLHYLAPPPAALDAEGRATLAGFADGGTAGFRLSLP